MADILYHDHIGVRLTDQAQIVSGVKTFESGIDTYNSLPPARNLIINGNMGIWQRGTSGTAGPNNTTGSCDRFLIRASGNATSTIAWALRSTLTSPVLPSRHTRYALELTIGTLATYTSSYISCIHYIAEKQDIRRYYNKPVVLSFWVKSSLTGIYSVDFTVDHNNTGDYYHYITEYTINQANTWEQKVVLLPVLYYPGAGTFGETGFGLQISWILGAATDRRLGSLNTWTLETSTSSRALASTNQVNWGTIAGQTWALGEVMFHEGNQAADFSPCGRNITDELLMCQRYYEKSYPAGIAPGTSVSNSEGMCCFSYFPTETAIAYSFLANTVYYRVHKPIGLLPRFFARDGTADAASHATLNPSDGRPFNISSYIHGIGMSTIAYGTTNFIWRTSLPDAGGPWAGIVLFHWVLDDENL